MSSVAFYVVAHQDDWEFFRGHQAYADIEQTPPDVKVIFIYTTAGDAGRDDYWIKREAGALRAQACALNKMQKPNNYHAVRDTAIVNGHKIVRFRQARVETEPFKVVSYHMRLPDGISGSGSSLHQYQSLQELRLQGKPITSLVHPDDPTTSTTYHSWEDFYSTLGQILEEETALTANPHPWVNAADWNATFNPEDHTDHRETSLALQEVHKATHNQFGRAWFKTYCTKYLPPNLDKTALIWKKAVYDEYASMGGCEATEWADYGAKSYWRSVEAGAPE